LIGPEVIDGELPRRLGPAQMSGDASKVLFQVVDEESASPFGPGRPYLARLLPTPFSDTANSIFVRDIVWLHQQGITMGCNAAGTLFCESAPVSRGEMAAFLVRALLLPPAGDVDPFTDDSGSIFEDEVERLAAGGITMGCDEAGTRFCPGLPVTRAEMAAFLSRAFSLPSGVVADSFTDDQGSAFEGDIERLVAAGITKGCAVGLFCPNDVVTRGQMAAFLHRAKT